MKLILGTDSLHPPLTGIGRYSYELSTRFLLQPGLAEAFESVEGFDLGRFHDIKERLEQLQEATNEQRPDGLAGAALVLRRKLAQSKLILRLYESYSNQLSARRLSTRPDAIYHSPNYHLPAGQRRAVVTIHDMSHLLYPDYHPAARIAWMRRTVPAALSNGAQVICVSESTRKDLLAAHPVDPALVTVTPLGADKAFSPRDQEDIAPLLASLRLSAGGYFLCVGTLEPRKNIDGLLDAYLQLPGALRQEVPLVLVGTAGWKCEALQARLAASAGDGVRQLGYLPWSSLPALYSGARSFVYPSFYEGFGLPVLEAQACGTPIITSDRSSLPEVASHAAMLIDPNDTGALAVAMQRAVDDTEWALESRQAGLLKAAEFSWDRCAEETLEVYRRTAELS